MTARRPESAHSRDSLDAVAAEKAVWRRRLRAARAGLDAATRAEASTAIRATLRGLPELSARGRVLAYAASGHEVDLDAWLLDLFADGTEVCLPLVRGERIVAALAGDLTALAAGWRGVREPHGAAVVPTETIDAVVLPGVGFDRSGVRLGQGGGHFDRLLADLRPGTPVVGVAFAVQLVAALPAEAHDRPVDIVVTERETLRAQ